MKQYRPEFPNPQFERREWMNLNGEWEFETNPGKSGDARGVQNQAHLAGKIIVPFCPESRLSGIGDIDFMECVWYRRDLEIPTEQAGKRVLLRFGAVDRVATVYVNGTCVGTHSGGFVGFAFDITDFLHEGVNSLCVRAVDEIRDPRYGHGKQSACYASAGCCYTRVTGIWQTVWVEFVPAARIKQFRLIPDIENCKLGFSVDLIGAGKLTLSALYAGKQVGKCELTATGGTVTGELLLSELHLWEVRQGKLYDLTLTYGDDTVQSYFGMRSLAFDGKNFCSTGNRSFSGWSLTKDIIRTVSARSSTAIRGSSCRIIRLRLPNMRASGGSIGIRCRRRRNHNRPELFGSYLQLKQLAEVAVKT